MTALAEKATSTDLVISEADQIEPALHELRDLGDVETLGKAAREAEAYRLYHLRNRSKDRADWFARIKVLAEAGIGWIDISTYPTKRSRGPLPPLVIAGDAITPSVRTGWRALGCADHRGLLREWLDEVAADPMREIGSSRMTELCGRRGAGWVERKRVALAINDSGMSYADIARQIGYAPNDPKRLGSSFGGRMAEKRMIYPLAWRIGQVVDLDARRLPPFPPGGTKSGTARQREAAKRARRQRDAAKVARRYGGSIERAWDHTMAAIGEASAAVDKFPAGAKREEMRTAYMELLKAQQAMYRAFGVA